MSLHTVHDIPLLRVTWFTTYYYPRIEAAHAYYRGRDPCIELDESLSSSDETFCSCPTTGTSVCGQGYYKPNCAVTKADKGLEDVTSTFLELATMLTCEGNADQEQVKEDDTVLEQTVRK